MELPLTLFMMNFVGDLEEGLNVISEQHVLVVDGIRETEVVLKTVLEPRGLNVNRVRSSSLTNYSRTSSTPKVVVLHEDSVNSGLQNSSSWDNCSKVIIGRVEIPQKKSSSHLNSRFLQAPFQYKELIHAIENLLEE